MGKETKSDEASMREAKALYLKGRVDEAFPLFEKEAKRGDAEAMYILGEYYSQGYGHVMRDEKKGHAWRKKGAAAGNILAELNTTFTPKCPEERRQSVAKALFPKILATSEAGDILAQNELADMYLYGFGTEEDLDAGVYWLKKLDEVGFWRPINKLGEIYWSRRTPYFDLKKARACFKKAADMGYGAAEMNLAVMYCFEKPRRMDLCIQFAKRSFAHGGEAAGDAAAFLDELYSFTVVIPQDPAEGLSWGRRSAALGCGRGMRNLGRHYRDGVGVPEDFEQAAEWYRKSAETGYPPGMADYGVCLRLKERHEESVKYFKEAAYRGDMAGMYWYGTCFLYGLGTPVDRDKARFWLERAAAVGDGEAVQLLRDELGIEYKD